MLWRIHGMAAFIGLLPAIAAPNTGIIQVTGVRSWSHAEDTRVIIETSGPAEYKADSAHNPDRLFLDLPKSRPYFASKTAIRRFDTHEINDHLVKRVRIAETSPNTTRIVFDLASPADWKISRLDAPDRLVIELRPLHPVVISSSAPTAVPAHVPQLVFGHFMYPPAPVRRSIYIPPAPQIAMVSLDGTLPFALTLPADRSLAVVSPPKQFRAVPTQPTTQLTTQTTTQQSTQVLKAARPLVVDAAPLPSENASRSLTRALGLKVNRVVIDAGHGGHDDGTIGPHGVLEKDVVLDVALRLSKLVQEKMGAEVILTRSDDTFIPLHERTQIANDHKADLFLSIHANSSPSPEVAGTESFFLNFTSTGPALDVAARENAGSDRSVGDLKDLIQSITMNDKIEESHTFAQSIQNSLYAQAVKTNATAHNRGVKKAPFVVLIGASMPSVLAEIGFLSNERDEKNLGKPEYRQKIAEALYKGLAGYSQSLSHFDTSRELAASGAGLN
jgi:N-acetylmuramoyl-L-alanine amidase